MSHPFLVSLFNFLALSTLCLAGACQPEAPVTLDRTADIASLTEAKVVKWWALYYEQDADGLAAFLNDDFVLIGGDGSVSSKTEEVDYLRNNPWNGPDDFLYHVKDIIFLGPDSAILYGQGKSTRKDANGQPCAHSYWSSNSFRRVDGLWRPSSSHVSGSKCEPLE